jgi:hypothetical protein
VGRKAQRQDNEYPQIVDDYKRKEEIMGFRKRKQRRRLWSRTAKAGGRFTKLGKEGDPVDARQKRDSRSRDRAFSFRVPELLGVVVYYFSTYKPILIDAPSCVRRLLWFLFWLLSSLLMILFMDVIGLQSCSEPLGGLSESGAFD